MSVRITYLERTNAMRNKERQKGQSTRYQVLIALKISLVFMVVKLCGLVGRYQHFRGTRCLHLQAWLKSTMSQLKVSPRRYFGRRKNRISDKFRMTKIATHGLNWHEYIYRQTDVDGRLDHEKVHANGINRPERRAKLRTTKMSSDFQATPLENPD
jgi:hypothetical protein